jgi:hypothetical protein
MKFSRKIMSLKVTSKPYILFPQLQLFKMANIKACEVESKIATVNVGP